MFYLFLYFFISFLFIFEEFLSVSQWLYKDTFQENKEWAWVLYSLHPHQNLLFVFLITTTQLWWVYMRYCFNLIFVYITENEHFHEFVLFICLLLLLLLLLLVVFCLVFVCLLRHLSSVVVFKRLVCLTFGVCFELLTYI